MSDIFPTTVFQIGSIPVRNSVVWTWFVMLVILALVALAKRLRPRILDMLIEFMLDQLGTMMGRSARPYLPLLGSLLLFLFVSNTITIVPFTYAPARDINTPIALGLVVFCAVPYFGVRAKGIGRYLAEYSQPAFLLPLQIVGDVSRVVSMSARLFGNVFATELIVGLVTQLVPLIVPLPLILINAFTGALHAYIFTVLAAVYIRTSLPPHDSSDVH